MLPENHFKTGTVVANMEPSDISYIDTNTSPFTYFYANKNKENGKNYLYYVQFDMYSSPVAVCTVFFVCRYFYERQIISPSSRIIFCLLLYCHFILFHFSTIILHCHGNETKVFVQLLFYLLLFFLR